MGVPHLAWHVCPIRLRRAYSQYEAKPFNAISRRVFLDTDVVNASVKFVSQIFEQEFLPDLEPTLAEEVKYLINIVALSEGGRCGRLLAKL